MFFDSWGDLGRLLVIGSLAYLGLVVLLRVSGNRTLSKLNAFDLVVTVALGSTLAAVLLNRDVSLSEGLGAFGLLVGLQYVVTRLSIRFPSFGRQVTAEPRLLARRGSLLPREMARARVTEDEVLAALRAHGLGALSEVAAVVLESDGSLSVVREGTAVGEALAPDRVRGGQVRSSV